MNVEKEWLETLKILILYKFADKGTAESTADEIYRVFMNSHLNDSKGCLAGKDGCGSKDSVASSPSDTHTKDYGHKEIIDKDYNKGKDMCECGHDYSLHTPKGTCTWVSDLYGEEICNCNEFVKEKESELKSKMEGKE